MDKAHEWTEEQITLLEQSFKDVYAEAQKEAQKRLDEYLKQFRDKDEENRKALEKGEITKTEYKQWRKNQMLRKQQLSVTLNDMAIAYNNADVLAMRYLNNSLPMILGANFDYGASEIFGMKWSFKLYDQKTIGRLIAANPQLLPLPKVAEGKNIDWYQKKLNSAITQGILHGDSIPQIAKQLDAVTNSGKAAAIRNVRTAVTNAECAGRVESYKMAKADGIELKQKWIATLDNRTRHSHAVLDGQIREIGEPFEIDGFQILYPGQPAPGQDYKVGSQIYNCRCTIVAVLKGFENKDYSKYGNGKLGDETYEQWKEKHIAALEEEKSKKGGSVKNNTPENIEPVFKSSFVPASTLDEAQENSQKFIEEKFGDKTFKGKADFKGISLDNANEINKALSDIYDRFDFPKISGIKTIDPNSATGKKVFTDSDAVMAYSPVYNGIFINKNVLKNAETLQSYNTKSQEAWDVVMNNIDRLTGAQKELALRYQQAGKSLVGDGSTYDYFIHEMGHHAQWEVLDAKTVNTLGENMKNFAGNISGYATASKSEYLAESFSAYMKSEYEKLDPLYVEYLRKLELGYGKK